MSVVAALACIAAFCHSPSAAFAQSADTVDITIDPATVIGRISDDFIGFGYETSAVAQPDFFSPKNRTMIQLYKTLSPHGLIRIGGNVSDHTKYEPDGTAVVRSQKDVTVINRKCLNDFGGFAKATGWHVMWGLNLGTGSKEMAVAEAIDVNAALGDQLQSFQIGNEVDFLPGFKGKFDGYHSAYLDYKAAIRTALPKSVFSGPDCANKIDWVSQFADAEHADMKLLTHHYYVGDQSQKSTSIEKMLKHDDRWEKRLEKLQAICKTDGIGYRINEVNSFSGGGREGVSDTFAEALWCLDFMYQLASHDCQGVNIETDINHLAWISHYSPIVHDAAGICSARPEYYGMLAFAKFSGNEILKSTFTATEANLSVYASAEFHGGICIAAINKHLKQDVILRIAIPKNFSVVSVSRLIAPSIDSKDRVTLGGAEVAGDGTWVIKEPEQVAPTNDIANVKVPHASAAMIILDNPFHH